MLALYVFALVIGAGLTLISILSDAFDVDGVEFDGAGAEGVDLGAGELDAADFDPDGGVGDVSFAKLLATYGLIYFALGFGGAGTLTVWLIGEESVLHLPAAILTGVLSGSIASKLIHYLKTSDSGQRTGDGWWSGASAKVLIPIGSNGIGEIRAMKADRHHVLRAVAHPTWPETTTREPEAWERVMVVEVVGGIARVLPLDAELISDTTKDES